MTWSRYGDNRNVSRKYLDEQSDVARKGKGRDPLWLQPVLNSRKRAEVIIRTLLRGLYFGGNGSRI